MISNPLVYESLGRHPRHEKTQSKTVKWNVAIQPCTYIWVTVDILPIENSTKKIYLSD